MGENLWSFLYAAPRFTLRSRTALPGNAGEHRTRWLSRLRDYPCFFKTLTSSKQEADFDDSPRLCAVQTEPAERIAWSELARLNNRELPTSEEAVVLIRGG